MSVPGAYILVVIIWSTTPLGINWSVEGVSPMTAAAMRMSLSAVIGFGCAWLWGVRLSWNKTALLSYLSAALGIFGAMSMVYWSAIYLPSGMISVFFGLSPILSALAAQRLGIEGRFTLVRWLALILAFGGLAQVFAHELTLGGDGGFGMLILLVAVGLFSLSGVLVKYVNAPMSPVSQTIGSLVVSVPFYLLAVALLAVNGVHEFQPTNRALGAMLYLAICGSLLGFLCYFYVLRHLNASSVALVTLMTPVFALLLGAWLNDEIVKVTTMAGAAFIGVGLVLYYWGDLWLARIRGSKDKSLADQET